MALTRDQFDVIANSYNDRQLNNKIKLNRRIEEVYEKIPLIKDLDGQIGVLAGRALRLSLSGNSSAKDTLREDIALISEQKKAALLAGGYSADYLDEIFTCPKCKDTGFIDGKPCECLKAEVVRLLYSRSELKEILERENFDTFEYDLYSDDYIDPDTGISAAENIDAVVDHCHYFINNFDKTFDNLLFYGRAGTGKTFLINCIANELINKSHTVLYLTAVSFFDLLSKITFNQKESSAFGQITKHELLQCDVLIIDDLGSEMANSFTNSALFDCLNYRLIHHKSTIISTNFSLSDLNEVYTDRTFSRILGNYNTFKIFGDDIRIKKFIN